MGQKQIGYILLLLTLLSSMTSEGLGEVFEADFTYMCGTHLCRWGAELWV
jgi:hypothetical protein